MMCKLSCWLFALFQVLHLSAARGFDTRACGSAGAMRLFLLVGQSNMAGRGTNYQADNEPNPAILKLDENNRWVIGVEPVHFDKPRVAGAGLATSFARAYVRDNPGVRIGLVPCAVGGSGIDRWIPTGDLFRKALARARLAERDGEIVGILWHQGEHDAGDKCLTDAYEEKFRAVVDGFRRELCREVPFVAGGLGECLSEHRNKNGEADIPYGREVSVATCRVMESTRRCAFVPSRDLLETIGDMLHFSTPSLREFGLRYYQAWKAISDETEALQLELDRTFAAGGGRVIVSPGRHLVGQLDLRSNVELHLEKGAVLEGKVGLEHYRVTTLPYSEGTWSAIVSAIGVTNVAITGEGEIFGNGTAWPQPEDYGGNQEGRRPRGVFFADCKNVRLSDFALRDSACWGVVFKCCENVDVRRLKIDNHANANNDGIDIEAKNVVIADCDIDVGDDAVCLKSNTPDFAVENVIVSNVAARSHCNALKLGTASHGTMRNILFVDCRTEAPRRDFIDRRFGRNRLWYEGSPERIKLAPGARLNESSGISAICVENVDGGTVENVTYRNIVVNGSRSPIFVRAGTRSGRSCGTPPSDKYVFRNVRIESVTGTALSGLASSISGVPGCRLVGMTLKDVRIKCRGLGETTAERTRPVPEAVGGYPDAHMFGCMLPAYGLYVRHVDGFRLENVVFELEAGTSDRRDPIVLDDVLNDVPDR